MNGQFGRYDYEGRIATEPSVRQGSCRHQDGWSLASIAVSNDEGGHLGRTRLPSRSVARRRSTAASTGSLGEFDRKSNAARKRGRQDAVSLGRRDEDVLIRRVGHGSDDGKHAVELHHADFAFDHGAAVLFSA